MKKQVLFTTSWDDGHLLDLRVADLLHKHGLRGTFYVPRRVAPGGSCNADGFAVMPGAELRRLGTEFEIGSHTLDHCSLDSLPIEEARHQVMAGKQWLEDELGRNVAGFCYPNGKHNATVCGLVRANGFQYARTTEDMHEALPSDPFRMPVSLQFYPQRRIELARALVQEGFHQLTKRGRPHRLPLLLAAVSEGDYGARLRHVVDRVCEHGGVCHIWGHSWEIDRFNGWVHLDEILRYAAERVPAAARVSNHQLALAVEPARTATTDGEVLPRYEVPPGPAAAHRRTPFVDPAT